MRRISHEAYSNVFGIIYLGLMTNALMLLTTLPVVVLLVTTDPMRSWPLIAVAAPFAFPAITAAFTVFRKHLSGSTTVVRDFFSGWRATWRRALAVGAIVTGSVVVFVADAHVLSATSFGAVVIPLLIVLAVLAVAAGLLALVALVEDPTKRTGAVLRASIYLAVRRWYLSAVSIVALGVQFAVFTTAPVIAIGLTASAALYFAWANSRFTLRRVFALGDTQTA